MQNAIQMTARLYEARDAMRVLLAERYQERIQPLTVVIQRVAYERQISALSAATSIAKEAQEQGEINSAVLVLAAYVEMVEPSPATAIHSQSISKRGVQTA